MVKAAEGSDWWAIRLRYDAGGKHIYFMKLLKEEITKAKTEAYRTTQPHTGCSIYSKLCEVEYRCAWSTLVNKLENESAE